MCDKWGLLRLYRSHIVRESPGELVHHRDMDLYRTAVFTWLQHKWFINLTVFRYVRECGAPNFQRRTFIPRGAICSIEQRSVLMWRVAFRDDYSAEDDIVNQDT